MKLVAVLCLLAAAAVQVYTMPNGAPFGACAAIQPMGPHIGTNPRNSADQSMNPFRIDLAQFQCPMGMAGYCYVPGETYLLSLYGQNCEQFRGLLVQARQNATGVPVGTFSDFTSTTMASDCNPTESAVTHNSRVDKTSEVLTWTAPANGTGHIAFHYAVVVIYQRVAANLWYAPAYTGLIYEVENVTLNLTTPITCPPPVQSCPALNLTNGLVTYNPAEPQGLPPLVNAMATYSCIQGTLEGNPERTCIDNGTWTGRDPRCGAPFTTAVSIWSLLALLAATYLL